MFSALRKPLPPPQQPPDQRGKFVFWELFLIVLVQYETFWWTGTVYWTDGRLYVNLLFAVVPMMFVLPYFNRYFFRMTGRIYLGPMVTCLVFIMILLTNTVSYLPL